MTQNPAPETVIVEEETPLMLAVYSGNPDEVRQVLETGADVHAQTVEGRTAFNYIGFITQDSNGNKTAEITRMLLEKGASPNTGGFDEEFPLVFAVLYQKTETIKLLLAHGADISKEIDSKKLFVWAAEEGHVDTVQAFLQHASENPKDNTVSVNIRSLCAEVLMIAADKGHQEIIDAILNHETDRRRRKELANHALFQAVISGKAEAAEFLIGSLGANPDAKYHAPDVPSHGYTPLMFAVQRHGSSNNNGQQIDSRPVIEALLRKGAKINAETPGKNTALDLAFAAKKSDIIDFLSDRRGVANSSRHYVQKRTGLRHEG